jgi:hypothetical protein
MAPSYKSASLSAQCHFTGRAGAWISAYLSFHTPCLNILVPTSSSTSTTASADSLISLASLRKHTRDLLPLPEFQPLPDHDVVPQPDRAQPTAHGRGPAPCQRHGERKSFVPSATASHANVTRSTGRSSARMLAIAPLRSLAISGPSSARS